MEHRDDATCTHCILVVDDDPNIRSMLVALFRREGYRLYEAKNGRQALEVMRSGEPQIVVLDLMMPEVSGFDVLRIRADDPELRKIPVIVISAAAHQSIRELVEQGICALLPKPFDLDALRALVQSCLAHDHGSRSESATPSQERLNQ